MAGNRIASIGSYEGLHGLGKEREGIGPSPHNDLPMQSPEGDMRGMTADRGREEGHGREEDRGREERGRGEEEDHERETMDPTEGEGPDWNEGHETEKAETFPLMPAARGPEGTKAEETPEGGHPEEKPEERQ